MEEKTKEWLKTFKQGEKSVFDFLKEIKNVDWEAEYEAWSNADEYNTLEGKLIKRYV